MATSKPTSFHVALDELKLTAAQKDSLSKAVNAAALHELARLDLTDGLQGRIPKEWLGIWIDRFKVGEEPVQFGALGQPKAVDATTVASVVLDGMKLTSAQKSSVELAIRTAAMAEVGKIGPSQGFGVRYPKEWLGIWIGPYGKTLK